MLAVSTHVLVPQLLAAPYDPIKDFSPVTTLTNSEFVLAVHPAVPANSLPELVALARSKPGQLNYSSSGSGGVSHLAGELFNIMAGVEIQHVPYKGGGPALADLIGGQVQMSFQAPVVAIPHINGRRLKAIAISGEKRAPSLPQVPTFTEAGLPDFDARYWFGVLAPAGTPSQVIDVLSAEIAAVWGTPDIKEKLASQAMEPYITTPRQFAALLRADQAKYARIVKSGKIKIAN
jgi:tripartite-type tricarboxylate transporter receptor subunit TctC